MTLVAALGAMEEVIQPNNGRESIDVYGILVLCSNMILASSSGWEVLPTLRALG